LKDIAKLDTTMMEQEDDHGNIEYKLKLANLNQDRIEHRTTQMKFRLQEGGGQAFYRIGVEDDGTPVGLSSEEMKESLAILFYMAKRLKADLIIQDVRMGMEGAYCEIQVRVSEIDGVKIDIKITMLGDQEAGKSTLLGVLVSGKMDNGHGKARTNVFRHKHEILDGRTSSISQQILGFDS
jgi:GTPase